MSGKKEKKQYFALRSFPMQQVRRPPVWKLSENRKKSSFYWRSNTVLIWSQFVFGKNHIPPGRFKTDIFPF